MSGLSPDRAYDIRVWGFDDSSPNRSSDWTGGNGGSSATLFMPDTPEPVDLNTYRVDFIGYTDAGGMLQIHGRASPGASSHNVFVNGFEYNKVTDQTPRITDQPLGSESILGQDVSLGVVAVSALPITYQWRDWAGCPSRGRRMQRWLSRARGCEMRGRTTPSCPRLRVQLRRMPRSYP